MSRPLSIAEAASQHPERIGLIVAGREYSFRELAARVNEAPDLPLVWPATATLTTAIALYKVLENRQSAAFVSQNSSESEVRSFEERVRAAGLKTATLVLFTSGSSGRSKGVRLSHEALRASARAANALFGWQAGDRWLCCLPLSHVGGLSVLLRALAARRTAVLEHGFDAKSVAERLDSGITHISLVPTMLWRLLEQGTEAPPSLRVCLMGGAALPEELRERAEAAGYPLFTSYGMTETASMVVCDGAALPGTTVEIDESGAIVIAGPTLMDGYLDDEENTAGVFRTADRGRLLDDGRLEVLGRLDDIIISGGENIDLAEVEAELRQHRNVRDCLALGVDDAEWGQKLVALIVRERADAPVVLTSSGFRRPKRLLFVDELPRLENGKVDRSAARRLFSRLDV